MGTDPDWGLWHGVAGRPGGDQQTSRADLVTYVAAMVLLILVEVVGAWLHIQSNMTAQGEFVVERFIRGAPFLAPLLFANVGALGLIVLLDPREEGQKNQA